VWWLLLPLRWCEDFVRSSPYIRAYQQRSEAVAASRVAA